MIIFSDVSKRFDDTFALENMSFSITPGELVMFTGHSGSGKTTLMRLLMREYIPTTGEITFDDTPLSKIRSGNLHHHRRKIGVIFQDYKLLLELTVWENIALALSIIGAKDSEIERRVTDLLDLVSLTDKAFLFPAQLSGGEAQRVSIARALSTAPKVIFADEPTGNLDPQASKNVISLLKKINDLGTTVMITTHNHDVKKWLGDIRHLELERGRIISDTHGDKPTQPSKPSSKKEIEHTEDVPDKLVEKEKTEKVDDTSKQDKKSSTEPTKIDSKKPQSTSRFWSWMPFFGDTSNKETTKKDKNASESESKSTNSSTESAKKSSSKKSKSSDQEDEKVTVAVEEL